MSRLRRTIIGGLVLAGAVLLGAFLFWRPTREAVVARIVRRGKRKRKEEPVPGTDLVAVSSPLSEDIAALPGSLAPAVKRALVSEEDPTARQEIAFGLAGMGEEGVRALVSLLLSPDEEVRVIACTGLTDADLDATARDALERALADPSPMVRVFAAQTAGRFAPQEARTVLRELEGSEDERVRGFAGSMLKRLGQ